MPISDMIVIKNKGILRSNVFKFCFFNLKLAYLLIVGLNKICNLKVECIFDFEICYLG